LLLQRIQEKVQLLLRQQQSLQKENAKLRQDLQQARDMASHHETNLEELKQRVDILRFSTGEMDTTEKREFEKRINAYIKEIDRCIALLGE